MSQPPTDDLETRLLHAARYLPYPLTPDIATAARGGKAVEAARRRPVYRLALGIMLALLMLAGLMSVPGVRAAVLEFLQIGAVRIFLVEPTQPALQAETPGAPRRTSIPTSTPVDLASIYDLGGETTLARARELTDFPIPLPAYPPDLGAPDRVYLQDLGGYMVVLTWSDPDQSELASLSLHVIGPGSFTLAKFQPELVETTTVNGKEAIWAVGPYPLELKNGTVGIRRMVDGNVLIWTEGEITYRLETGLPMEEAVKIAESLR